MSDLVLSIDQGTTSTRAIILDETGATLASEAAGHHQSYPSDGWVEHDAEEIWLRTLEVARAALARVAGQPIRAIGITNQRETTLIWDRRTGAPIAPAIVWQDRRTAAECDRLRADGHEALVQARTGLLLDPYFSATKIAWLLDHVAGARAKAERGELAFGTIDTWLIWKLTGGRVHASDATNAARTQLYDIRAGRWDSDLIRLMRVPPSLLPDVRDSAGDFGVADAEHLGTAIPILGVAGDQQAAAIGQACFDPGTVKSTYGTGCFMLMNTGSEVPASRNRLLGTIAYRLAGSTTYALEGSIFMAGAVIDWLKTAGLISKPSEALEVAGAANPASRAYLVPAFVGMGAPYWAAEARGAFVGMTRDTGRAELVAAAVDSVAYQTRDLLEAMRADTGREISQVRVDGGMAVSDAFLRRLADLTGITITRASTTETTALGAGYLAMLQAGIFKSLADISALWRAEARFLPAMPAHERDQRYAGWKAAVARAIAV